MLIFLEVICIKYYSIIYQQQLPLPISTHSAERLMDRAIEWVEMDLHLTF